MQHYFLRLQGLHDLIGAVPAYPKSAGRLRLGLLPRRLHVLVGGVDVPCHGREVLAYFLRQSSRCVAVGVVALGELDVGRTWS